MFYCIIFGYFSILSEAYAESRFLIYDRHKEISPHFEFEDSELRQYAISYFNIITTYHESVISLGDNVNLLVVERKGLFDGGVFSAAAMSIFKMNGVTRKIDANNIKRKGCGVVLFYDYNAINSSYLLIDSDISFSDKIRCFNDGIARSFGFTIKDESFPSFMIQPATMIAVALADKCSKEENFKLCLDAKIREIYSLFK